MVDINKHKFLLVQILKDIYSDVALSSMLGFKGGTALMLFYGLPRFSVVLDFDLLKTDETDLVYERVKNIVLKYGNIKDEAKKHFGIIVVLDYGMDERNLKLEISNRLGLDRYETKNYLGIPMQVMVEADLFANKLCALLDRGKVINRDIFDCYFLMQRRTPVNIGIVEKRMKMQFSAYVEKCIIEIEKVNEKRILSGLGDLMDEGIKTTIKQNLKKDTIALLKLYKEFPIKE